MVVTLMMSMMVEMMVVIVIMEEKDNDQDNNYTSSSFRSHRKKKVAVGTCRDCHLPAMIAVLCSDAGWAQWRSPDIPCTHFFRQ